MDSAAELRPVSSVVLLDRDPDRGQEAGTDDQDYDQDYDEEQTRPMKTMIRITTGSTPAAQRPLLPSEVLGEG